MGYDVGGYHFRLLDASAATALTMGTTRTQTLNPEFRTDMYRFTGAIGQRLYYDALDADGDPVGVQLISPSGAIPFINGNSDRDAGPFTLTEPGTYYLLLQSQLADNTADYSFRLIDAAQSPARALTFDTAVIGTNDPTTSASVYRFTGTNGQRLFFDFAATNVGAAYVTLYGPRNQPLYGGNGYWLSTDFEQTLPADGTYVLTVGNINDGNASTTPFSFRVVTSDTMTNALTLGASVTGLLDEPGEEDRFTFTGSAGQRLYYDALDTDGDSLNAFLLNPAGGIVHFNGNAESDVGPFTLTDAGPYTLVLRSYGEAVGSFRFRLLDLALPPTQALALDTTVNGLLDPGTAAQFFSFSGTTGQRLYFDGANTNTAGVWYLYDQNNGVLGAVGLSGDFEVILPRNTTYVLGIFHSNTNHLPYSIRVITPATTSTPYVLGTSVTNSLTEPGEERRYTLTGSAGQRLFYDALEADFDAVNAYLLDPFGSVVFIGGNADSDVGIFTLTHSGIYTLLLKGSGEAFGDFRFRLLDLAAAPAITYGVTVTAQLSPQIETDLYRINGVAGQRLSISNVGASSGNANWYFYRTDNGAVLGQNILNHLGHYTLPSSGTYAISIIGASDLIGTLDYQFRVTLLSSSNGTPAGFDTVRSGTTAPGQTNSYTYTGTAGLEIYLDHQTNNAVACHQLIDPNGEQVLYICPGSDAGPYFLPTNGIYTLNVIGQGDGDFQFRWLNLAGPAISNPVFGTAYSVPPPPFRTDVYRFTGTVGQRLVYDALEYEFEAVAVRLYNPNGGNVFIGGNADSDVGPFTLTEAGTYHLVMETQADSPDIDYSFRLIDAAQAPATALALDTQINAVLDPGTRLDVYRFNGTAGQRLFMDAMPTNGPGSWYLYGPQNQYVGANSLAGDFEATLPQPGQYLLVIGFSADTNPIPYSIRIVTPTDTTNALVLGATINGALAEPGETDYYTFAGTVGQRLLYDALDNDFDGVTFRLTAPSGNVLYHQNADSDTAPFTLAETGLYTVRFFIGDDPARDYSFRILDAANAPLLAYDMVVTNNITNGLGVVIYRVPALATLRLFVDGLSTPDGSAVYYLYDPDNRQLTGTSLGYDMEAKPVLTGTALLVLYSSVTNDVPYSFRIIPGNHAPVLALIGDRVINEETNFTFTATTTDVELPNDVLTWSLDAGAPAGAIIDPVTGVFSWTPTEVQGSNTYTVTVRVRDDGFPLFEDFETFTITVNEVNKAPTLQLPATQTINELTTLNVTVGANDLDVPTNVLTFALVSGPSGPSNHVITVTVTDTNALAVNTKSFTVTNTFTVSVVESNKAPVLTVPGNQVVPELVALSLTATATDPDLPTNTLAFALVSGPSGLTVSPAGAINWLPSEADGPSTTNVVVRVFDNGSPSLSHTQNFQITVEEVNVAPTLTAIPDRAIHVGTLVSLNANANDTDVPTNALTFSLLAPPSGASIGASSGAFSWTPTNSQLGITTLRVRVADGGSPILSATQSFNVRVEPPPLLSPLVLSNSNAHLAWSAITSLTYRAQYSSNLVVSNWSNITGDVIASSTNATKVDPTAGGATNRFYRVVVVP